MSSQTDGEQATQRHPRYTQRPAATWRRVLVVRSCRLPQFRRAVEQVTVAHPGATVYALTDAAFSADVKEAGALDVIVHQAQRIGPLAIGAMRLQQLRSLAFDAVVIPIMSDTLAGSANLLRLAAAVGTPWVAVSPWGASLHVLDGRLVRRLALTHTLRWPAPWAVLGHMLRALLTPAPPPRERTGRIRVLHIINSLGLGGAQTQCAELVNRTPPDRYDVSVLVLSNDDPFSRRRFARDGVAVTVLKSDPFAETPIPAIADHCRRGGYDIVHTWLPLPNMYGTAAARLAGVARVLMSIRSAHAGHFPWCQWWFRPGHILASRLADVVTVNTGHLVADHARWALYPARRIAVVPNGLDPALTAQVQTAPRERLRATVGVSSDTPVVGIVGRLSEEKGHDTFLRILHGLHRQGRLCHAVIAGDGPREADLRALATSLGLDGAVTFLGARHDAHDIIAGLDALVLASRTEGFPNVVLEAALLQVPSVCTAVGGVPDILTDCDAMFPVGDVTAGVRALERVLVDPAAARLRAAATRQHCLERFSADGMVARWLALYEAPGRHASERRSRDHPHRTTWSPTVVRGEP